MNFLFTDMFIELSSTFQCFMSKSLNLIGCRGDMKGKFSKLKKKSSSHKPEGDEAEIWHTCLGHQPLNKSCFLFLLDKTSGCYGNTYFR